MWAVCIFPVSSTIRLFCVFLFYFFICCTQHVFATPHNCDQNRGYEILKTDERQSKIPGDGDSKIVFINSQCCVYTGNQCCTLFASTAPAHPPCFLLGRHIHWPPMWPHPLRGWWVGFREWACGSKQLPLLFVPLLLFTHPQPCDPPPSPPPLPHGGPPMLDDGPLLAPCCCPLPPAPGLPAASLAGERTVADNLRCLGAFQSGYTCNWTQLLPVHRSRLGGDRIGWERQKNQL